MQNELSIGFVPIGSLSQVVVVRHVREFMTNPDLFFTFLAVGFRYHLHAWMICVTQGGICFVNLNEERSMPIESLNSVIALGFLTVWLMVGQFSFIKH